MTGTPSRLIGKFVGQFAEFLRHMRARWFLYVPIFAVWGFAYTRLFVDPTPRVPVLFNWTPSLPYTVAVVDYRQGPIGRGDLVVYAFEGPAGEAAYPGLRHQALFKRVAGVAGDVITVQGREVFVNGQPVGRAKTHAFDRRELSPIAPTVIPAGHLYVQGTSADSFDSRYSLSGLVREQDVKSRVIPLL